MAVFNKSKKLKIAMLAPLTRPVNQDTRGSRPRVVFDLVRGLVEKGHDITTFGSGNSILPGKLIPITPISIYEMQKAENQFYQHMIYLCRMMDQLIKHQDEFDIIHSHLYPDVLPVTYDKILKIPLLVTPHIYMWKELIENFMAHPKAYYSAVSDHQLNSAKNINFISRIYNGIEVDEFEFNDKPDDYLLFFGRMKDYAEIDGKKVDLKGVTTAIAIAEKIGMKLKIAGNVESEEFFDQEVKPHLSDKIEFIGPVDAFGPIGFKQKVELYKNAKAFLFPIQHIEAFGMTMLESMACGTPVIGSNIGATKEAIIDGKVGYLADPNNVDDFISKIKKIDQINRLECRKYVEEKFSAKQMIQNYEDLYYKILSN